MWQPQKTAGVKYPHIHTYSFINITHSHKRFIVDENLLSAIHALGTADQVPISQLWRAQRAEGLRRFRV